MPLSVVMNVYDTIHRFGPLQSAEENIGLQTVNNIINNISKGNNTELKRNNEEKELKKKDEIVHSEAIPGYQGDKSIEEMIIGDEKFIGNKSSEQKQSSKKLATVKQTLDVLSLKSQNTDSADFVLNTNNKSRKKQKSENILNETTNNFPPRDSYLLSQHTQPKNVKNKKRQKLKSSMTHSNKAEDSLQSLPGPCSLSKQPPHIEAPKTNLKKAACLPAVPPPTQSASPVSTPTSPTTKEKNTAVKLLRKQGHPNRDEVAVQSLPGPCSLSKQLPHIEATKTNLKKAACLPAVPPPTQSASPVSTPTTKEKNTAVKLLSKQGHPKRDEVAVQSLPGPCSLSKQPPHIEATKTNLKKAACLPAVLVPNQRAFPVSTPTTKEKNTAVKLLSKQGHPKRDEVAVQSLPGPCSLSKQPPHIEATKTNLKKAACLPAVLVPNQRASPVSTPTTKEKNTAVKLLSKQGHPNRDEVAVQSLPGPRSLSMQPPHIEAPKTHLNKAASVSAVSVPKQRAFSVSTPTRIVYNTKVKLLGKQGHSNKAEDSVQSLLGSTELSKQPSYIEAPKTNLNKALYIPAVAVPKQRAFPVLTPTRIVYNTKVKLLGKQGHSNKAEDSVQSLLGSTELSKQPSYIEAPKTNLNKALYIPAVAVPKQRAFPVLTPTRIVYNTKVKLLGKQDDSNKLEDCVQSLSGSSALSKQPSYLEAPKTNLNKATCVPAPAVPQQRGSPVSIPTTLPKPVEYNHKEVILFVKQAWQDFEKEKINGRFNILEYKRE